MQKAMLFQKTGDAVKCTACKHYCIIKEGGTGICGVRKNENGELYLIVYGKAAAYHIDPVEKKPLFHFLPGTTIFSLGTIGCNFGCTFCQNWDISQATREIKIKFREQKEQTIKIGELAEYGQTLEPEKIVEYCYENNIPSIAYTYNEPAIFFEYAYDTAKLAHKKGIKNVFVSNGYESEESLNKIKPFLDAMNIDLKAFTEEFYMKTCKAKLQPVLETIKLAKKLGIWVEITTLVIPNENDSEKELAQIAEFIAKIDKKMPWHITRFHPDYKMLDKEITPIQTLEKAYEIGKKAGLDYVYVGNASTTHENTFCPKCNKMLIQRNGYNTKIISLKKGRCECGEKIPGIWK
jgi:pyruvate formate lyase activating enzyme